MRLIYLEMLVKGETRWKGFTYENELEAVAAFKTNYLNSKI